MTKWWYREHTFDKVHTQEEQNKNTDIMKKVIYLIVVVVLVFAQSETVFAKKKKNVVKAKLEIGVDMKKIFEEAPLSELMEANTLEDVYVYYTINQNNEAIVHHVSSTNALLLKYVKETLSETKLKNLHANQSASNRLRITFRYIQ